MELFPEIPKDPAEWRASDNEYSKLGQNTTSSEGIIRSARNLESYKCIFGEGFGKHEELILDVGAGDSTMADEIESLTDHKAKVVRFDRDYGETPPSGEADAIAGDATKMPFADASFDRIVSHNMMYYLGREKGTEAVSEMMRVLKEDGEAAIYPAKPFTGVDSEIGHKETHSRLNFPNLVVTKPSDFASWEDSRKQSAYEELAKAITGGETTTKLIHWGIAKAIQRAGTHRTTERGSSSSLKSVHHD